MRSLVRKRRDGSYYFVDALCPSNDDGLRRSPLGRACWVFPQTPLLDPVHLNLLVCRLQLSDLVVLIGVVLVLSGLSLSLRDEPADTEARPRQHGTDVDRTTALQVEEEEAGLGGQDIAYAKADGRCDVGILQ